MLLADPTVAFVMSRIGDSIVDCLHVPIFNLRRFFILLVRATNVSSLLTFQVCAERTFGCRMEPLCTSGPFIFVAQEALDNEFVSGTLCNRIFFVFDYCHVLDPVDFGIYCI